MKDFRNNLDSMVKCNYQSDDLNDYDKGRKDSYLFVIELLDKILNVETNSEARHE